MQLRPSDFTDFPYNSILQKIEPETIAQNVMVMLESLGNVFRKLTWEEYRARRLVGNGIWSSSHDEFWFEEVISYCKSANAAILFSPEWHRDKAPEKEGVGCGCPSCKNSIGSAALLFAHEATELILRELNGRSGFDDWYESLDNDIQNEIYHTMKVIIVQEYNCMGE